MRYRRFVACAVHLLCLPALAAAQIPQTFKNLQVLPKDIPRPQLISTMRSMAGALGVRCTHCHVGPDDLQGMDFATDEKDTKQIARHMMRMTAAINGEYMGKLPAADGARQQVTCLTCHRREAKPPRPLHEIIVATALKSGVAAAIQQYRGIRAEYFGSGLYDFREPSLNIVATTLRENKRFDDAIGILRLNAEMFPHSPQVQIALGDVSAQTGDVAAAEAFYRRALELEPGHPVASKALDALKAKRKLP